MILLLFHFLQSSKPIDVIDMLEADSVDYDDTKGKEFCFKYAFFF